MASKAKKTTFLVIGLLLAAIFGGLLWLTSQRKVNMSAEAHRLVSQGALLLDVRDASEYAERHLPGAVNIPVEQLLARLDEVPPERDVVVYCNSGARSGEAAHLLEKNKRRVFSMGPMAIW